MSMQGSTSGSEKRVRAGDPCCHAEPSGQRRGRTETHPRGWFAHVDRGTDALGDGGVGNGGIRNGGVGAGTGALMQRHSGEGADESRSTEGEQRRTPENRSSRHRSDPPDPSPPVYRDPEVFASLYPKLDEQLRHSLVRRGLDPDAARDVSQEVWARLFKHSPHLTNRRSVARWVSLVGYQLAEAWQERDNRATCEAVPDRPLSDVADEVIARLEWSDVATAFQGLPARDRDALLVAANEEPRGKSKQERDSMSLRVHRARQRLRSRMRGWLVGLPIRWLPAQQADAPVIDICLRSLGTALVTIGSISAVVAGWPSTSVASVERSPSAGFSVPSSPGPPPAPDSLSVGAPASVRPRGGEVPVRTGFMTGGADVSPRPMRQVVVGTSDNPKAVVGEEPRQHERELFCYGNMPVLGGRCIYHPSRDDPDPWSMVGE